MLPNGPTILVALAYKPEFTWIVCSLILSFFKLDLKRHLSLESVESNDDMATTYT